MPKGQEPPPVDNLKNVPGPESFPAQDAGDEKAAESEAEAFAAGNLDTISQRNEHSRRELFRDVISYGAMGIYGVLILATAAAIFAVGWHFLMPKEWGWLDPTQLVAVKTYVFSGAVVAAISGYMRRYLD